MEKNKDYVNGIKFLLRECKKNNINIHEYSWVCDLSMVLSWFNACQKFWCNTFNQHRLHRIPFCKNIRDIMFMEGRTLFRWDMTPEGGTYWHKLLARDLFGNHLDRKVDDIRQIYGNYEHRLY